MVEGEVEGEVVVGEVEEGEVVEGRWWRGGGGWGGGGGRGGGGEVVVGEVEEGEVVEGEQTILAMLSSCVSQVVFHKFLMGRCTNTHHMQGCIFYYFLLYTHNYSNT